jgi:hypothetical protein
MPIIDLSLAIKGNTIPLDVGVHGPNLLVWAEVTITSV